MPSNQFSTYPSSATNLKASNFFMFPCVYFFFPETRYRSLEEMDDIFKKSSNVFDVVNISIKEPYRFDKKGQLKVEYLEDGASVRSEVRKDEEKH